MSRISKGSELGAMRIAKGALVLWGLLLLLVGILALLLYRAFYEPSQVRQAKLQLVETAQTLREYKLVFGRYPKRLDLLSVKSVVAKPDTRFVRPKLNFVDPWGRPLVYRTVPKVMLISTGPDGKESEDDIVLTIEDEETDSVSLPTKTHKEEAQ